MLRISNINGNIIALNWQLCRVIIELSSRYVEPLVLCFCQQGKPFFRILCIWFMERKLKPSTDFLLLITLKELRNSRTPLYFYPFQTTFFIFIVKKVRKKLLTYLYSKIPIGLLKILKWPDTVKLIIQFIPW